MTTDPSSTTPPPATRTGTPGWRDPRLWIGVLVVAASVVLGARIVGGSDDTVGRQPKCRRANLNVA